MGIRFNVPGKERKKLVQKAAEWDGSEVTYLGAPTFTYRIGEHLAVDKDGVLENTGMDESAFEMLVEHLVENGFECDMRIETETAEEPATETVDNGAEGTISIRIPHSTMSDTATENLKALIEAKKHLIIPALGGGHILPICWNDEGCIDFPWLPNDSDADTVRAWTQFISKLCEMAKNAKRVTAKEKDTDNDKYAFRCFLLRLGFIGDEYKADRKVLLKNLSGSSAFKSGQRKETEECSE